MKQKDRLSLLKTVIFYTGRQKEKNSSSHRPLKTVVLFMLILLLCIIVYMIVPFIVYGEQSETEAVKKARQQAEKLRKQLELSPEKNCCYREALEEARKNIRQFYTHRMPQIERYRKMLEKKYGINRQELAKTLISPADTDMKHYLMPDERIYIFMSSSVPLTTWNNYAESIDKIRDPNIVMVIRGCIGGCTYIKPTLEFIQKVILPGGFSSIDTSSKGWQEELKKKARRVQIWIDPLLFRYYNVKEVPCIVYAKNVHPLGEMSEGFAENLDGKPEYYSVYGDWNLSYMLKKLYEKSSAGSLKKLLDELNRSWYSSGK